ncbi:MAG: TonB family protein [Cellvibrionaceae bacterium]
MSHTLIPRSSTIKPLTGLVAIMLAIALHLGVFLHYSVPQALPPTKEAVSTSIKIGLKTFSQPAPAVAKSTPTPAKPKPIIKQPVLRKTIAKTIPKPLAQPIPAATPKAILEPPPEPIAKPKVKPRTNNNTSTEETLAADSSTTLSANTTSNTSSLAKAKPEIQSSYENNLVAWLQRYKRYPSIAKRKGQQDIIELKITIDREGNVLSQNIIKASIYQSLNKATIRMIKKASPLPPVPKEIQNNKTRFTFIVPVVFKLN